MPSLRRLFLFIFLFYRASRQAYAPNGGCGWQNGGALCDPDKPSGICCSSAGFCGLTAEYCHVSLGCQLNCTDGTPTTTYPPASAATSSATASSRGLTPGQLSGIIAGSVLSFALIVVGILCWLRWRHKERIRQQTIDLQQQTNTQLMLSNPDVVRGLATLGTIQGLGAIQGAAGNRLALTGGDIHRGGSPLGAGGRIYNASDVSDSTDSNI